MRARLDETAIAEWQRLMTEWDEAGRELDKARMAAEAMGSDEAARVPLDAEVDRLTTTLQTLQAGIDALIKQTQSIRDPQRQDLLVATIQRGMAASDRDGDKPQTPPRITARSK